MGGITRKGCRMAQATTRRTSSARSSSRKTRVVGRHTQHGQAEPPATGHAPQRRARRAQQPATRPHRPPSRGRRATRGRAARRGRKPSANGVAGTLSGVGNSVGSTVGKGRRAPSERRPRRQRSRQSSGTAAAAGLAGGLALAVPHALAAHRSRGLPVGRHPAEVGRAARRSPSARRSARPVSDSDVGDVEHGGAERQPSRQKRDSPLEVLIKGLTSRHTPRS